MNGATHETSTQNGTTNGTSNGATGLANGTTHGARTHYRLDGKVALVTGSGRGIGAAMATELGRCGANVVVNYAKSSERANKVVEEIKAMGVDAIAIKADISYVAQIGTLFAEAIKHFGKLDIVCSNSGVVSFGHLEDVTEVSQAKSRASRLA